MKFRILFSLVIGMVFSLGLAPAAPVVFTINNTLSSLTLSGSIIGSAFTTQGAGSLTTTYSGDVNADLSGSTIQFTGSSTIIAKTNGVWQPAVGGATGSALADYGAEASTVFGTSYGAARNIVLDVNSASLTLTGTNFDSSALVFSFSTNSTSSFDYYSSVKHGTLDLAGDSTNSIANEGSLTTNGNVMTLAIQINTEFTFTLISSGDTLLDLTGQLVATNVIPAPIISSIVVTNQDALVTVENALADSQLQTSSNLTAWSAASVTTSNNLGLTFYTTPLSGKWSFFRVRQ
jgi:hypothetical protein